MIVVPYYNRPSLQGCFLHFSKLLESTTKPILLYNVPNRTGRKIDANLILKLKAHYPHLIGIKQACDDFEMIDQIKQIYPDFLFYLGEDHLVKEALDHQVDGMISVSSHLIYPLLVKRLNQTLTDQQITKIDELITQTAKNLFSEASPAPLKYLLCKLGFIQNQLRLPLCPVSQDTQKQLDDYLKNTYSKCFFDE